jgi:hypothetical protein
MQSGNIAYFLHLRGSREMARGGFFPEIAILDTIGRRNLRFAG